MWNMLGMQFICYDGKDVLLGTFADKDGVEYIVNVLNDLHEENKELKEQYADDCNEANSMTVKIAELTEENKQLKSDLKSYQNMVKQYINLHIDKIRRRYVNLTKEEVAERTRIIRDLEQLKKELVE